MPPESEPVRTKQFAQGFFVTTLRLLRHIPNQVFKRGWLSAGFERVRSIRMVEPSTANESINQAAQIDGLAAPAAEERWETLEEGKAKILHRPGEAFYNPAQVHAPQSDIEHPDMCAKLLHGNILQSMCGLPDAYDCRRFKTGISPSPLSANLENCSKRSVKKRLVLPQFSWLYFHFIFFITNSRQSFSPANIHLVPLCHYMCGSKEAIMHATNARAL